MAETNHLAFGWFAFHDTLAIPGQSNYTIRIDEDGDGYKEHREFVSDYTLNAFKIDTELDSRNDSGIELKGTVEMDSPLLRSAFIDDKLYAVAMDSIKSTEILAPNNVIAEVTIRPPNVEEPEDIFDPRLPIIGDLQVAARQDLASVAGVSPTQVMTVATEADRDRTRILLRVDDEHYVYNALGDQLELSREDYRPVAQAVYDWHNEDAPLDTTGDGELTPRDALVVINMINDGHAGVLPTAPVVNQIEAVSDEFQVDANGDGFVTALDALLIINNLNAEAEVVAVEEPAAEPEKPATAVDAVLATMVEYEDTEHEFVL